MQCKHCNYPSAQVVYTKQNENKNIIERRRECVKCGLRFTTHEKFRDPTKKELRYKIK